MSVVQGRAETDREEPPDQQQGEDANHQGRQSGGQRPVLLLRQERSRSRLQQQQLHPQHHRWVFLMLGAATVLSNIALVIYVPT